jgi:hypothetical protein
VHRHDAHRVQRPRPFDSDGFRARFLAIAGAIALFFGTTLVKTFFP